MFLDNIVKSAGRPRVRLTRMLGILALIVVVPCLALAQLEDEIVPPGELKRLSVEELLNLEVTSVSRHPEKLTDAASAIQVVTGTSVERSGATDLLEALQLASNLHVATIDARQWAVSARGFNGLLANKLQVLIDGRSIYTPLYSGVFWHAQHVLLHDLDRIEVISGPGGTLWGSNAVNGVINITNKASQETQGLYATAGAGSQINNFGALRYGGRLDSNVTFRVYGTHFDRKGTVNSAGRRGDFSWHVNQGGFRADWGLSDMTELVILGNLYQGNLDQPSFGSAVFDGQNLTANWAHSLSLGSRIRVNGYFDRMWTRAPLASGVDDFTEEIRTYDLDFQHRFPFGERQDITWGANYRLHDETVGNNVIISFLPAEKILRYYGAFIQDEISLSTQFDLTLGSKFEHNVYTGWEVQPTGRIAWRPDDRQTFWGAISRAVRTPSRIDREYYVPILNLAGGPNFQSENLLAYEAGYRTQLVQNASAALSLFFHDYTDLQSSTLNSAGDFENTNNQEAESWGAELTADGQIAEWWQVRVGYSYLHIDLLQGESNDPQNRMKIQSFFDLSRHWTLDIFARYVDVQPRPRVPSHFTFDARLAWRIDKLELALVGQNLFDKRHPEFGPPTASRQEVPSSFYGKVSWGW